MKDKSRKVALGVMLAAGCAAGTLVAAAPVSAAQSQQPVTCNGVDLTIRSNNNNSSDHGGWNAVQVVDGGTGHLIPTSFSGQLVDNSRDDEVIFTFSQTKGNGHANRNQATETCTQTQTGTLGDFLEPGDELPPGTSPDDQVTFTFTATVVHRG